MTRRGFLGAGGAIVLAGGVPAGAGMAAAFAGSGDEPETPTVRRYRTLGRTGFRVSDIAFGGLARSPEVLRYAHERGVNYFDTGETYGNGESERIIGGALRHIDRASVFVTTKLHLRPDESSDEILGRFARCLERLGTSYVDALFIHHATDVAMVGHAGFHAAVARLKSDGKVRHAGVSCHGPRGREGDRMEDVLLAAVEDGRFDLVLLVYNFMNSGAGEKVLGACAERKIGTTVMKSSPGIIKIDPVDPENLTGDQADFVELMTGRGRTREEALDMLRAGNRAREGLIEATRPFAEKHGIETDRELRAASLQWALRNEEVHSVCLSMKDFDGVDLFVPLSGTDLDEARAGFVRDYRYAFRSHYCRHGCNDCASACAAGVPVSSIMRYSSYFVHQGREKHAMRKYSRLGGIDGSLCLDCGAPCAGACPHGVDARALMIGAHARLGAT